MVMMHLNGAVVYGSTLRINISKHQSIFVNKNSNSEEVCGGWRERALMYRSHS